MVLALGLLAPTASALDLTQQPFTVRTFRQSDAVHAIDQAPDGMLWFGSRVGLVRFDGERFVEVQVQPVRPGSRTITWVRRLRASRDGSLWVAIGSGDLAVRNDPRSPWPAFASHGADPALVQLWPYRPTGAPDRIRRFTNLDGLPDPWVWALAEDADGGMWAGTEKGLVRFTRGRAERFSTSDGLPASFITALAFTADGDLYVGTTAGAAVRRRGRGRFEPLPIREPVTSIARDGAGRVWATVPTGLWRLDPDGHSKAFPIDRPMSIALDGQDQVWVGGFLLPAAHGDSPSVSVFVGGEPRPLATSLTPYLSATDLLVDREGSIWFSLREGGVTQLSAPAVRNFGVEEGLSGQIAFAVRQAGDGSTYVTTTGGVSRYLAGKWTTWPDGDKTIGRGPRDIAEGPAGTPNAGMWFVSEGHLLRGGPHGLRMTGLDFPPFNAGEGGSRSIVIARSGDVFISRVHPPGLLRLPGGDVRRARVELAQEDGLCPGKLTHGLEAADGALWFVGDYGVRGAGATRIQGGSARCLGTADGLPDAQVGAIVEDREGVIWLGTGWGAGLVRYRDGKFRTVPASVGLPRSSIVGLLDDGRGFLWICSETGIWRVPKQDLHRCADDRCPGVRADVFGKQQGMRTAECVGAFHPNLTLDGQGNVWAATLGGVSVLAPPERAQRGVLNPVIEEISVDGVPLASQTAITLGPRQRAVVVRYTAPTFVGTTRPQLRHRLVGFDLDWVSAAPHGQGVAHYHDLASGRYTLELAAGDGPRGSRYLTIVAMPPIWRTPWFLSVTALLLAGLGLALHFIRVSRIRLRHRAMNEERVRIARELHDGLAQKLRAVGLLSDRVRPDDGGAPDRLRQMRRIISEAHAELRRAISDMREGTEKVRIETLMERLLSQLVIPPGVQVNLETSGSSLRVSRLFAHEAHLVAKEALLNALHHADARTIEIGVLSDDEGLHIWVRDDGRGGLPSEADAASRGHYGLIGMRERTRRIGGVLSVRSEPGRGTEVSLFVSSAQMKNAGSS